MNSSQLKSYLTGLILGDGYIDHGVQKRAFRIKSINLDFIEKIEYDLNKNTNFKVRITETAARIDNSGTNHRKHYELIVSAHPYFAKMYHYFYNDFGKRIISKKSLEELDWNGWANWYMSDGYICRVGKESGKIVDRRVELCTDRYPLSDIQMLSDFISSEYKYRNIITNRGKTTHRIRISLIDAQNFLYNISPFVVNSFLYKLDLSYNDRPKWMNDEYYGLMKNIQSASPQIFG